MPFADRAGEVRTVRPLRYGLLAAIMVIALLRFGARTRAEKGPDYREHDPGSFRELVDRSDVYTLDVHVPEQDHLEGTDAFVPYDEIRDHRRLLPDEGTPIALYCRSDAMSHRAADVLSELGYEEVHLLRGGIEAWEERGLPTTEHRFDGPGVRDTTSTRTE